MNENKIKICYVVSSLCNEGPVNVMYNIIQYLDFNKFEVYIITLREEKDNSLYDKFAGLPIEIEQLNIRSKLINIPKILIALRNKLKKINPVLLHTHCPRSLFLSSVLSSSYIKVHTIHNLPGLVEKSLYGNITGAVTVKLILYSLKKINNPITCAEYIKNYLLEKHKIIANTIKNGSDFGVADCNVSAKDNYRKNLGLVSDKKYFVFVGRFSPEKNPLLLINLFAKLERSDIALIMLGDGPLMNDIDKNNTQNIVFTGFTNKVREYLLASDYFVSSSLSEGLPNSVIEAMSVGLPLLLSNIPAHKDIINGREKKAGFLFDLEEKDFIKKMEELISLPYEVTCNSIKQNFVENYTAKGMSEAYQKTYLSNFQ